MCLCSEMWFPDSAFLETIASIGKQDIHEIRERRSLILRGRMQKSLHVQSAI
jgi:hypothetical protein